MHAPHHELSSLQARIDTKGDRLFSILLAASQPRIGTYLALAKAIEDAGHLAVVVHPSNVSPSPEELSGCSQRHAMQISIRERDPDDGAFDGTLTKLTGTPEWDWVEFERQLGAKRENARVIARTGNQPQALIFRVDGVTVQASATE